MSDEKRPYRMTRRAELEAETRQRIVESTAELHARVGPARTSVSAIAELAGVRRSTVYRHFPDEEALVGACSAHWRAANPAPDLQRWAAIEEPGARLEIALGELYAHYRRTGRMIDQLLRDEHVVPAIGARFRDFHAYLAAARDVLLAGRGSRGRRRRRTQAAIGHALAFRTWQSLTEQGLADADAAELMCRLVEAADRQ